MFSGYVKFNNYLQVSINDFPFVKLFKGYNHLSYVKLGFMLKKSSFLQVKEHLSAWIVFKDQVKEPLRLE
jgi:hypothetical protein